VIFTIFSVVMAAISIGVWEVLPKFVKDYGAAWPLGAFLLNLMISCGILFFTGVASVVGSANLAASIILAGWILKYRRQEGIKGLKVIWTGPFHLRIWPVVVVRRKI